MTPKQIVGKCLAQGVVFYREDDGFDFDGPDTVLTPKFIERMRLMHDALLPAVLAHLAQQEAIEEEQMGYSYTSDERRRLFIEEAQARDTDAHAVVSYADIDALDALGAMCDLPGNTVAEYGPWQETIDDLPADLIAEGEAAEAAIQAEQDKRLQDAVDAARAEQMPTTDRKATNYDKAYKPIAIRGGTTLDDPGWWLLGALERAQKLREKYGETWWHKDTSRPIADAGGPMLWEEIEVVRDWWYDWRHKKGLLK